MSGHLDPSGRLHLGGRVRPATPHTFALARFNVNMSAIPVAPSETNFRAKSASVLGICWLNGPSNAKPPNMGATVGDCTSEGGFHGLAFRQGIAGATIFAPSCDQVLANYSQNSGYIEGQSATDSGADEVTVLTNAVVRGYPNGDKPVAFMSVDPTNVALRRSMSALFGGLMICLETPENLIAAVPGDAQANGTFADPICTWGTGTPDPTAGHCVFGSDLAPSGQIVDSWGMPILFTDDGIAELAAPANGGGCYVLLDTDVLVVAIQTAPGALDYRGLVTAWDAEGGNVPVPGQSAQTWLQIIEAALGRVL